jgi:hypothetical protein
MNAKVPAAWVLCSFIHWRYLGSFSFAACLQMSFSSFGFRIILRKARPQFRIYALRKFTVWVWYKSIFPESGNPGPVLGSGTWPSYRSPETPGWSGGPERARVTGVRKPRVGPGVGNAPELPESGNPGLVLGSGTCPGYRSPETPGWSWGRERARVTGVRKPRVGPGVGNVSRLPESGSLDLRAPCELSAHPREFTESVNLFETVAGVVIRAISYMISPAMPL